jgi:hypothetical protein
MAQGAAEKNASIGLASQDRFVASLFAMPPRLFSVMASASEAIQPVAGFAAS